MNDSQSKWLQCYVESGNGLECVREHYPDVSPENQSSKASQLKRKLQSEIVNGLQGKLAQDAPKMLNVLKDIGLNTSKEVRPSEQLKAASEWLSRCGLSSEMIIKVEDTRTHADMVKRLKELSSNMDNELLKTILPSDVFNKVIDNEETKH